jgi:hypothetical protein
MTIFFDKKLSPDEQRGGQSAANKDKAKELASRNFVPQVDKRGN